MVAPLVMVGTRNRDGTHNLAPKHMALPIGSSGRFAFVCTPRHATYGNVADEGAFTVSYPRPADVVATSLAASPRCEDAKPYVGLLETFPAQRVQGVFVKDAYLFLECELERIVDGFGDNGLIAGRVVAAHADPKALRSSDRDDADHVEHQFGLHASGDVAELDDRGVLGDADDGRDVQLHGSGVERRRGRR